MSRSTYTLFIGVFSVALYLFMTVFILLAAVAFEEDTPVADSSEETETVTEEDSDTIDAGFLIMLADFVFMFIASLLMVYGAKKERHQYIAPWVILSAISLVAQLAVIFFEIVDVDTDTSTFVYVLSAVVSAGIWYPVFKYYQGLKNPKCVAVQGVHCTPAGYVAADQVCALPSDYSHVNAKYVPAAVVAPPPHNQIVYPSVPACNV